jgi:DASS family divalent anion:Na+ symporter
MIKSGLGKRISFYLIRMLGGSTLGVGYAITFTDLLLGIVIPSNLARSGSILFPLIKSVCEAYGSTPQKNPKKLGAYLMMLGFQADNVVCALFMTGQASNLLLGGFAAKFGVRLDHQSWFLMSCFPGIILILLMPLILYFFYPPELKKTPEAPALAKKQLQEMGPWKLSEKIMLTVFAFCIVLWYKKDFFGIHVSVTALLGLVILLAFHLLSWKDIVQDEKAWDMFIWYGGLVMIADGLEKFAIADHFIGLVSSQFSFSSWQFSFMVLLLVYTYTQYVFASLTAHIMAFFVPFLGMAIAFHVPAVIAVFGLFISSNLCACLTHFGTTPAPIYFGSGYIPKKTWWKIGFFLSVFYFFYWWILGSFWLNCLNLDQFLIK